MKNKLSLRTLLLAGACALCFGPAAHAADTPSAPAPVAATTTDSGHGLLGQNYLGLSYGYIDLQGTRVSARSYDLTLNQNLTEGVDALLNYTVQNSTPVAGGRISERIFDLGVRAFTTTHGFKPYVEAGAGWVWQKAPLSLRLSSPLYFLGTGVEFQVAQDFSLTPFVRYLDAPRHGIGHEVDYGVKANYWLSEHVGLTAAISRNNSRDMQYNAGVTFRY